MFVLHQTVCLASDSLSCIRKFVSPTTYLMLVSRFLIDDDLPCCLER